MLRYKSPEGMDVDEKPEDNKCGLKDNQRQDKICGEEKGQSMDKPHKDFLYQRSQTYSTEKCQHKLKQKEESLTKTSEAHLDRENESPPGRTKDGASISGISDTTIQEVSSSNIPEGMFTLDLELPADRMDPLLDQRGENKESPAKGHCDDDEDKEEPAKAETDQKISEVGASERPVPDLPYGFDLWEDNAGIDNAELYPALDQEPGWLQGFQNNYKSSELEDMLRSGIPMTRYMDFECGQLLKSLQEMGEKD